MADGALALRCGGRPPPLCRTLPPGAAGRARSRRRCAPGANLPWLARPPPPSPAGLPTPGTQLRVVDPESLQDVADGQQGLILARGPGVMAGYFRNDDATAKVRGAPSGSGGGAAAGG